MSPPHALAADNTGWQSPTCPQSPINLVTRINEGRGSEETNFNLPRMTPPDLFSKAGGGLYQYSGDSLYSSSPWEANPPSPTPTATEPVHNPQVAWPMLS